MDKKKLALIIGSGVLAVLLLSMLIVGLVDGIWPWDGPAAYAKVFNFTAQEKPVDTATPTDPTDEGNGEVEPGNTDSAARNPVIEGDEEVKTEVDLGNNGNSEENGGGSADSGNSGNSGNSGDTSSAPDADTSAPATQIPGWGN